MMTSKPLVSVLLGVYDEPPALIARTVDSILQQTYTNFELFITLDKPDNTFAKQYIKTIQDKRVRLIINKKNLGYGLSKRKAIDKAKGKYIAITDCELYYWPNKLNKQVEYAEKNNTDLLFTEYYSIDEVHETRKKQTFPKNTTFKNYFFKQNIYCFPTLLIRSEILKKNNYVKAIVPDDFDLYFRLFRKGYTFDILHEPLTDVYNTQQYREKDFYLKRYLTESKNMLLLLIRNMDLFWNAKGFWKKLFSKLLLLNVFILLHILNKIGLFGIIWKQYLLKKWKKH